MTKRISEPQLIIPALQIISNSPNGVPTSELIVELRKLFDPKGEDAAQIPNRPIGDIKFNQIVRNLTSHETLTSMDLAIYADKKYYISDKGKEFLSEKQDLFNYLKKSTFSDKEKKDMQNKLLDDNTFYIPEIDILEGELINISTQVRKRSSILREYAFQYFKSQGKISCQICGFDFGYQYGKYGEDYIELHHKRPISVYQKDGEIKKLEEAIKNLIPVCSNCHKMIHKNHISVDELTNGLKEK